MNIKNFLSVFLFAGLIAGWPAANAASFAAKISSILFFEQGDLIYIYVIGGTRDRPACAGSNGDYISFSMKRPRAKEYIAGLMFAYGSGKDVIFTTYGSCTDQTVSDTLMYFAVQN